MWVLFVFASFNPSVNYEISTTSHEFQTRESCIAAANALKTRKHVADAYCVKK